MDNKRQKNELRTFFVYIFVCKRTIKERRGKMDFHEKAYTTKEVSITLDIGDSTLRKWCLSLEKNGYNFIRNDQNKRLYTDRDLVALRHFQMLVQQNNFPMENASLVVASRFQGEASESGTGIVLQNNEENIRSTKRYEALEKKLDEQQELIKALIKRLEERDEQRDQMLMQHMREIQETKQLLLSSKEEEDKDKGFFARLFGK
jgi:DNA-binding transcriptional MerR regulator